MPRWLQVACLLCALCCAPLPSRAVAVGDKPPALHLSPVNRPELKPYDLIGASKGDCGVLLATAAYLESADGVRMAELFEKLYRFTKAKDKWYALVVVGAGADLKKTVEDYVVAHKLTLPVAVADPAGPALAKWKLPADLAMQFVIVGDDKVTESFDSYAKFTTWLDAAAAVSAPDSDAPADKPADQPADKGAGEPTGQPAGAPTPAEPAPASPAAPAKS